MNRDCAAFESLDLMAAWGLLKQAEKAGILIKFEDIPELLQTEVSVLMGKLRKAIKGTMHSQEMVEKPKP